MIVDFNEFEDGAAISADVCIIGAGAAGIALARSFMVSNLQICVLESGGFEYDADTQSLYEGEVVGQQYFPLSICRLRYLGGTTNHWGGWCAPQTPLDFERRSWIPHGGWPISREDLDPYYEMASPICGAGPFIYHDRLWERHEAEPLALDRNKVVNRFWQRQWHYRFGEVFRTDLRDARNLRVILNANVVNIQTNAEGNRVERLDLRSLTGKSAQAKARIYVLACGGIENARLLMVSSSVQPNGLGNDNDLVGRFFMDHIGVKPLTLVASDPVAFLTRFRLQILEGDTRFWAGFCPGDALQRDAEIANGATWVDYTPDPKSGPLALRTLWRALQSGKLPSDLGEHLVNIMADLDDVISQTYQRIVERDEPIFRPQEISMQTEAEQTPNPDSRITLSDDRDLLGMRLSILTWRLSEVDKRSIRALAIAIGEELGRLNIARVKLEDWLIEDDVSWPDHLGGRYHHIGTTRMSDDPATGVVDANCALHGVDNLYVAGSSVFPTAGYVNPTLTIVALALRLGDHIRSRLV